MREDRQAWEEHVHTRTRNGMQQGSVLPPVGAGQINTTRLFDWQVVVKSRLLQLWPIDGSYASKLIQGAKGRNNLNTGKS